MQCMLKHPLLCTVLELMVSPMGPSSPWIPVPSPEKAMKRSVCDCFNQHLFQPGEPWKAWGGREMLLTFGLASKEVPP